MVDKANIENLKDIIIIGSDTCHQCHDLKEELENYYPNLKFQFKLFKDLETGERTRIRNFLILNKKTLPVIILKNNEIYSKTYQEFLNEAKDI